MIQKTLAVAWTALQEKVVHCISLNTLQDSKRVGFKLICVLQ